MRLLVALLAFLAPVVSIAGGAFSTTTLSADGKSLTLVASEGVRVPAPTLADQVAFSKPLISPNGQYVGWLALFPNCCTSYPVPLRLVVVDRANHMQTFEGSGQAIFSWCFLPDSRSIAFMHTVLHGTSYEGFQRHSLVTGRLLSKYEYPDGDAENRRAREVAPVWVRCVSQ